MKLRQPVWFRFGGWQAPVLLVLLALFGAAPAAGQEAQLSNKKATEAELERKTRMMDEQVKDQLRKQILCEADLPILRERISAAEAALADRVPKLFEIHKQKRFAEIHQMLENRDLGAMQRCAERGYMELDDVLRNVYD